MNHKIKTLILGAALSVMSVSAQAAIVEFDVFAQGNSSTGGTALDTGIDFAMGDIISGFVAEDDVWAAGSGLRWSNANGLNTEYFASGTDESGASAGTQIGQVFGNYSSGGFSFAYGTLVGEIDGQFYELGTDFDVTTTSAGRLFLSYWDSNSSDNRGSINVSIDNNAVEVSSPASLTLLLLAGIGLVGFSRRTAK